MKNTKKRAAALMLAVVLLFPFGAWAAEEETDSAYLAARYLDADTIASWAEPFVRTVTELELMIGGSGVFNPGGSMTRAEFATLLSRMQAQPFRDTAALREALSDVPTGAWYEDAVLSVMGEGLMDVVDGAFRPDAPVTREEVSVGIARLLQLDMETALASLQAKGIAIADLDLAAPANRPAMAATYLEGIMVGSAGVLNPVSPIQRQEMAKVIGILYQ